MKALVFDISGPRWTCARFAAAISRRAPLGPLGGLRLRDIAAPALPGPNWVRLRPLLGGICGTDLSLVMLRNHPATILQCFASFPAVLGHEVVATVEEVGPAVNGWTIGRRVCVEPSLSCVVRGVEPVCASCAAGRFSLCQNTDRGILPPGLMIGLNSRTGGAWSSSFVAHASQLYAVPDSVPNESAVLVDPIGCAVHAVLRHRPRGGQRILINGGGIVGLGIVAAIRALGCDNAITAVVRHGFQAEWMRRFGATDVRIHSRRMSNADRYDDLARALGGRRMPSRFGNQAFVGGVELTYDCIGTGGSLTDSMKWTGPRGTVVAVGTSQINVVDTVPLWFSELNLVGCSGRQIEELDGRRLHTYEVVFEWLASGRLDLSGLLTHRFPLSSYRDAFDALLDRGRSQAVKAAFVPE